MQELVEKLKVGVNDKSITIIGIDGLGGSGKTFLSKQLKEELEKMQKRVVVLHIDDFITTRAVRYNDSVPEWECYYNLQWRYDYFIQHVLAPIKKEGNVSRKIERYKKEDDLYEEEQFEFRKGDILLLEGIFLQRDRIRKFLDFVIYLDVQKEVRLSRVIERDKYIGNKKEIVDKYERRYFPAEEKYVTEYRPTQNADYVIKG